MYVDSREEKYHRRGLLTASNVGKVNIIIITWSECRGSMHPNELWSVKFIAFNSNRNLDLSRPSRRFSHLFGRKWRETRIFHGHSLGHLCAVLRGSGNDPHNIRLGRPRPPCDQLFFLDDLSPARRKWPLMNFFAEGRELEFNCISCADRDPPIYQLCTLCAHCLSSSSYSLSRSLCNVVCTTV